MESETKTVRMYRDEPQVPQGPTAAEVHPDAVAEYALAGWIVAEGQDLQQSDVVDSVSERVAALGLDKMKLPALKALAVEQGLAFASSVKLEDLRQAIIDVIAAEVAAEEAAKTAEAADSTEGGVTSESDSNE